MKKYDDTDERAIGVAQLVREWTRSGLLERAQEERILPELKVELRRTNVFLRLILFGFGLLIIGSAVVLAGVTLDLDDEVPIAALCFSAAIVSLTLAEYLIARFRLYRFGIEEAAAVAGGILLALAVAVLASVSSLQRVTAGLGEFPIFAGLATGSVAALAIYMRFGYLYAALASMLFMSLAPSQLELSQATQRLISAILLGAVFVVTHSKSRRSGNDFPDQEYRVIRAIAWLGIYISFNLHLSSIESTFRTAAITGPFYWFTYVVIWLLPVIGLFFAVRERDRPLLDVNIVLGLVTLATNKPYLGAERQTWDPILLGALLIGTAVILRRRLSGVGRNGFTATRILLSDARGISAVGTASAALHIPELPASTAPDRNLEPGGGRSGGAGASGTF